jgi:hypothetical protein
MIHTIISGRVLFLFLHTGGPLFIPTYRWVWTTSTKLDLAPLDLLARPILVLFLP